MGERQPRRKVRIGKRCKEQRVEKERRLKSGHGEERKRGGRQQGPQATRVPPSTPPPPQRQRGWGEEWLTCCKSERGTGSLASTWWGWLVRDGNGGSFFQWVRLLLSTAKRVLAEGRGGWGQAVRPQ